MTYHNTARADVGFFGQLAAWRSSLVEARLRRLAYRQTVHELSDLSDRELADLGLSRSMIRQVALDAARDVVAR